MRKFNAVVGRIESVVGVVMMLIIVGMVFVGAITRYFGRPIIWSVDLAQLLFIWVCMFGADAALKNKAHVGVDMIVKHFPVKLQKLIVLATYVLCMAFLAFMVFYGIKLCASNYLRSYQTLKISYSFGTAAVPVGSVFMLLTLFEQMRQLIQGWNDPHVGVVVNLRPEEEGSEAGILPPIS